MNALLDSALDPEGPLPTNLRVGIIGAGGVVTAFHLPTLRTLPGVEVKWIHDVDPSRARKVAADFAVREVAPSLDACSAVDAVLIATPVGARRELVASAAAHGWAMLCEKPFARTVAEHDEMVRLAKQAGVPISVGFVRRYFASTRLAKALLAAGPFGPLVGVGAGEGGRLHRTGRGVDWYQGAPGLSGGGVLMESGSHVIDQVLELVGAVRTDVTGCSMKPASRQEVDAVVRSSITLVGSIVPFQLQVSRMRNLYNGVVFRCERGDIRLRADPLAPVELSGSERDAPVSVWPRYGAMTLTAAFRAEWLAFLSKVGRSHAFDEDTGAGVTAFLDGAYAHPQGDTPRPRLGA